MYDSYVRICNTWLYMDTTRNTYIWWIISMVSLPYKLDSLYEDTRFNDIQ